jgi:DNA-binding NarL/FixJ family response regulator
LVVDDHAVVRAGLRNLINDEPDFEVCGEADSNTSALTQAQSLMPDVVVLDLRLPDGLGTTSLPELKQGPHRPLVLVLTSYDDESLLLAALKAGADGYLLKDVSEDDIVSALRRLEQAGAVMPDMSGGDSLGSRRMGSTADGLADLLDPLS